jgi:hypothetical protein
LSSLTGSNPVVSAGRWAYSARGIEPRMPEPDSRARRAHNAWLPASVARVAHVALAKGFDFA